MREFTLENGLGIDANGPRVRALTNDVGNIKTAGNIVMLVICVILVPVFILWEQRQERLGKPALIPNSLWRNSVFTNVCLMVMFSWAVINVMELYCSLL